METLISKLPFIEILKVGFSGFCFLMALLAYLLLNKEQSKKIPNQDVLKTINKFLYFGLSFGVLVLFSSTLPPIFSKDRETAVELEGKVSKLDDIISAKMIEISMLNKENTFLKDRISNIKNINKQNLNSLTNIQLSLANLISGFEEMNGPIKLIEDSQIPPFSPDGFYGHGIGSSGVLIKTNKSMKIDAKNIFENLEKAVKGNAKLDSTIYNLNFKKAFIDQLRIDFFPLRIRTKTINISLEILINGKMLKAVLLGEGKKWVSNFPQTFFIDLGTDISMNDLGSMVIKTKIFMPMNAKIKSKKKEEDTTLMISIYGRYKGEEAVLLPPLLGLTETSLVSNSFNELEFRHLE